MYRRHQIFLEQLQNGDLNEDEALLASDELFKYGGLEENAMPTGKVKDNLGADSEDVVPVGVDAENAGGVSELLALVDRMGRTAAEHGLTEQKLAQLLEVEPA